MKKRSREEADLDEELISRVLEAVEKKQKQQALLVAEKKESLTSQVVSLFYSPPSFEDQIYELLGDFIQPTIGRELLKTQSLLSPLDKEYKYEFQVKYPNSLSGTQLITLAELREDILKVELAEAKTQAEFLVNIFCSNDRQMKMAFTRADLKGFVQQKAEGGKAGGGGGDEVEGIVTIIKSNIKIRDDLKPPEPETKHQPSGTTIGFTHHFVQPPITVAQIRRIKTGSQMIKEVYFRPDETSTNILMTVEIIKEVN